MSGSQRPSVLQVNGLQGNLLLSIPLSWGLQWGADVWQSCKGWDYRDTKAIFATWVNTAYSPCHKAGKRNLCGSGKSLSRRSVIDLLPDTMSTFFFFFLPFSRACAIRKQSVVLPVQGQALLWYCQDAETSLTYIPGSCPTLAVAVAWWVCLIRLAYKSNTDDYLPLSDVIKC